jgi:hypothetical protein
MSETLPRTAWDMTPAPERLMRDPDAAGWIYGTPPGISEAQWPLDPNTGYPMQHGFTLLLPEEYRVRGKDIVAISFFGAPPEHYDGGPHVVDGARVLVLGEDAPDEDHEPSVLLAGQAASAHPRLHRFEDILGGAFAIIELTREEFEGPLCPVPAFCTHPMWEELLDVPMFARADAPAPVAIALSARAEDPNVGKVPIEGAGEDDDYTNPFDEETYELHSWAEEHAPNHIGGTAMPIQAYPELSPFYIEFDEDFGGFNFGDGRAQLCLKTLTFDWACH